MTIKRNKRAGTKPAAKTKADLAGERFDQEWHAQAAEHEAAREQREAQAAAMSDRILARAPAWLEAHPVRIRPLQRLEADLVALAQELAQAAPAPTGRQANRALVLLQLALELTAGRQAAERDLRALLAMWEPVSKAADQLADRALELSHPEELSDEIAAEAAKLAGLVAKAAESSHRLVGLNDQDTPPPPPPPAGKEAAR